MKSAHACHKNYEYSINCIHTHTEDPMFASEYRARSKRSRCTFNAKARTIWEQNSTEIPTA